MGVVMERPVRGSAQIEVLVGDCRTVLKSVLEKSVNCIVTSPPYFGLRDYGVLGQVGLEQTPDLYVAELVGVFREARRVLRDDGTLWLNLGDSYWSGRGASMGVDPKQPGARRGFARPQDKKPPKGIKPKDLIGIPWRVAFALQADGWYLRSSIVWHKPNAMPETAKDRPTASHEMIFMLSKSRNYFYDHEAVKEPATNGDSRAMRNVWSVPTKPFAGAHFATFPPALIEPCIKAGSPVGGLVLDPFGGAGTTGMVAAQLGRSATLIELNPEYAAMSAIRSLASPAPKGET